MTQRSMTPPEKDSRLLTRAGKTVLVLGSIFWVSIIFSYLIDGALGYISDLTGFLSAISLVVAIVVTIPAGISRYGFLSRFWLQPPVLCIIFLLGIVIWRPIKLYLDDWQFQLQLPEYTAVVDGVKAGTMKIPEPYATIGVDPMWRYPGRARAVFVTHCGEERVIVRFPILGRGGALGPHWGYLYDDCDDPLTSKSPVSARERSETYYHSRPLVRILQIMTASDYDPPPTRPAAAFGSSTHIDPRPFSTPAWLAASAP
jgi:hypothetical protein